MIRLRLRIRLITPVLAAAGLTLLSAGGATAHVLEHAAPYTIALGWKTEPTYVGEQNAVQVIITDGAGRPVDDLAPDDLKVVVSTSGQQSGELTFDSGFDADTGLGTRGEYDASILPTAVGDYTFHLTGTVHATKIDFTASSSEQTFNAVVGPSDIEFPNKLPTMDAVALRLDRIDARIATLGTSSGPTQAAVDAAQTSATDARQAADRAFLVGAGLGLVGIVVGVIGLGLAARAARRTRVTEA